MWLSLSFSITNPFLGGSTYKGSPLGGDSQPSYTQGYTGTQTPDFAIFHTKPTQIAMNRFWLYSIMLIMNNAQDDNKRKFLKLMIEAKNSCLQEIDDVYTEAEKVIDTYLKDKKDQSKK